MIGSDCSDEEYQRRMMSGGLFASSVDGAADEASDDDDCGISEHSWTCPGSGGEATPVSISYHLAFLAPGHGDSLWNSSMCIAEHILRPDLRTMMLGDGHRRSWPPLTCLEFGAGAALPSLALLREGAGRVIVTDRYVNEETFEALRTSVERNAEAWGTPDAAGRARIASHTWGEDAGGAMGGARADLLVASDCIYDPTYHAALLRSARRTMDPERGLFVIGYSFHGNVPRSRVLDFFQMAQMEFGMTIVREFSREYDGQGGIGSEDRERGAVYVKVLAGRDSIHFAGKEDDVK